MAEETFFEFVQRIDAERRTKHAAVLADMGDDGWILCWQIGVPQADYFAAYADGVIGFNAETDCWVATPQFGTPQLSSDALWEADTGRGAQESINCRAAVAALTTIVREFDCGRTPIARDLTAARAALARNA